jgi:hypothetical protein
MEQDVPHIVSTTKKKVAGKTIPHNVVDAPMDNVSFPLCGKCTEIEVCVQQKIDSRYRVRK